MRCEVDDFEDAFAMCTRGADCWEGEVEITEGDDGLYYMSVGGYLRMVMDEEAYKFYRDHLDG